jgi:hypothetical protein
MRHGICSLQFRISLSAAHQHADAPHPLGLLRTRRERPSCRRAAEKHDESAPAHGAYPKARDHGLSIAGLARASQQKRAEEGKVSKWSTYA